MKLILIFFVFITTNSSWAAEICSEPLSYDNFKLLVHRTREQYFPELQGLDIRISPFQSNSYFFQACPKTKNLIGYKIKRVYLIQLNLKLLNCPPTEEALIAILVHEMEHIKDFSSWSSTKIAKHGMNYLLSKKYQISYERQTDKRALEKGINLGLANYRKWVYQWLTPEELKHKREMYLTPEEIIRTSNL